MSSLDGLFLTVDGDRARDLLATESLQDRGQTFDRSNRDRVDHKLHMGDPLGSEGAELIGEFLG